MIGKIWWDGTVGGCVVGAGEGSETDDCSIGTMGVSISMTETGVAGGGTEIGMMLSAVGEGEGTAEMGLSVTSAWVVELEVGVDGEMLVT